MLRTCSRCRLCQFHHNLIMTVELTQPKINLSTCRYSMDSTMWTKHNNLTPSSTPQTRRAARPSATSPSSSEVIIIASRHQITFSAKRSNSVVMIRGSLVKSTVQAVSYTTIKVFMILRMSSPKCYTQAPPKYSCLRMAASFLVMLRG